VYVRTKVSSPHERSYPSIFSPKILTHCFYPATKHVDLGRLTFTLFNKSEYFFQFLSLEFFQRVKVLGSGYIKAFTELQMDHHGSRSFKESMTVFDLFGHLHVGHEMFLYFIHSGFQMLELIHALFNVLNPKTINLHVTNNVFYILLASFQDLVTHFIYLLMSVFDITSHRSDNVHNIEDLIIDSNLIVSNIILYFLLSHFHLSPKPVYVKFNVLVMAFLPF
jgi:hypothetical protein